MTRERRIDYSQSAVPKPGAKAREPKRLERKTPMRQTNPERREQAHADAFGPQSEACRLLPCAACGYLGASIPHHEPAQSVGGLDADTLPLCDFKHRGRPGCHQRRHQWGAPRFWSELGLEPQDVQQAVRDWMAAGCPRGALPTWGRR